MPRVVPSLGGGEIHVWLASLDSTPADYESMHDILSAEERERAARFKIAGGRERYTMGRGFLRMFLAYYTQMDPARLGFAYNPFGKPRLLEEGIDSGSNQRVHFNLSHSGGLAVYGFTRDGDLGVDIEKYRDEVLREKLADRFFSPEEAEELASLDSSHQLQGFFTCWTRKESYIKARGDGLSRSLSSFAVSLRPQDPPMLRWCHDDPQVQVRWRVWNLEVPQGYAGCAVAPAGARRCLQWDLNAPDKPPLVTEAGSPTD